MKGTYLQEESWEKQSRWLLENGVKVTLEFNPNYGEMISRLDFPDGTYWHCSNGRQDLLPDWAKPWLEKYLPQLDDKLLRPNFEKVWPEDREAR